jgi:hypothetical protein
MLMGAHKTQRMASALVKFMQQGTTIMTEVYCETLKNCVGPFRTKRHGMLTYSVVLVHDKERLHTAAAPEHFSWELFEHPP